MTCQHGWVGAHGLVRRLGLAVRLWKLRTWGPARPSVPAIDRPSLVHAEASAPCSLSSALQPQAQRAAQAPSACGQQRWSTALVAGSRPQCIASTRTTTKAALRPVAFAFHFTCPRTCDPSPSSLNHGVPRCPRAIGPDPAAAPRAGPDPGGCGRTRRWGGHAVRGGAERAARRAMSDTLLPCQPACWWPTRSPWSA